MYSRLFLLSTTVFISICPATVFAGSGQEVPYTLQVAAFPGADLAEKFIGKLVQAGEHPSRATVELQGRYWTRVFVGLFTETTSARRYGESLISRGIISEFFVRKVDLEMASRPRRVMVNAPAVAQGAPRQIASRLPERPQAQSPVSLNLHSPANKPDLIGRNATKTTVKAEKLLLIPDQQTSGIRTLADFRPASLALAPCLYTAGIPRPEPVALAFRLIVGETAARALPLQDRGGLWLSGDTAEALERLQWIAGEENAKLVKLGVDGRVQLDRKLLVKAAGLERSRVQDPLLVAAYVSSNEGLLLLVQLAEGRYRYRIHLGRQVPTRGKTVEITGSINLDRNFDSRINKYRKDGRKLDLEQPPEGFDALVGLNPAARWFNLNTNYWVQAGEILFHELAEAHAKVELGLDYLERGSEPGAHAIALDRERRLKSQRPGAHIVVTAGSNRVLRTQEEIRLFYAESSTGASQR